MYDFKAIYEARSVADAVRLLGEHPEAKILAGGSDLLVEVRGGKHAGCEAVSIYLLDELRGVSLDGDGAIRIKPLTSFSHVSRDPVIREYIPVLGDAAGTVGGPQLRNIGTIGGNICNGVTSADTASTLMAWEAVLEITGPEGVRRCGIKDFYITAGKVDLRPAELLTAILIPKLSYVNCYGCYIKYAMRGAMDIATTGCSVNVALSEDKKSYARVRIAFGVAGPVPMRAPSAEASANGSPVGEETAEAFSKAVLADINPRTSWRAAKEFRQHIAVEMARRALIEATQKAGGVI
ncbi:MAG: xanthine dehydrogenase FAD-binding subunit XdhB [Firmicutes bacterium]|nr:xanthine dehydrogenase FAD-binding subunit XdhB [Bacillota bacterium]